jgi:hypothetical protein
MYSSGKLEDKVLKTPAKAIENTIKKGVTSKFTDERPEASIQRKLQDMANLHTANAPRTIQRKPDKKKIQAQSNSKIIQRFTEEDVKFMYGQKMGLRHHGTKLAARTERLTGTKGGDAVPLNPLGAAPQLGLPLMGFGTIPQKVIEQFTTNVSKFIAQSLTRTVNINLGVTTPHQIVNAALSKSTFLLVSGMKGTEIPKDVEKRDYAGLGKAGKQEIKPQQIVALMSFDNFEAEMMNFFHDDWDSPITTVEKGDEVFNDMVLIFVEKLKDAVYKLRTGEERFMA